jgi:hypothetical protein
MPFLALSLCECKRSPDLHVQVQLPEPGLTCQVLQAAPCRLYQASARCAWHACHAQPQYPTQRGMLTSSQGVRGVQHGTPGNA